MPRRSFLISLIRFTQNYHLSDYSLYNLLIMIRKTGISCLYFSCKQRVKSNYNLHKYGAAALQWSQIDSDASSMTLSCEYWRVSIEFQAYEVFVFFFFLWAAERLRSLLIGRVPGKEGAESELGQKQQTKWSLEISIYLIYSSCWMEGGVDKFRSPVASERPK